MDTNGATTTLRARLIANSAVEERTARVAGSSFLDDDPFAGDDILWADEDWIDYTAMNEEVGLRLWSGLMLGLAVSGIGWCALVGSAYLVYQLII